jgi:hypothetical protein
MSRKLFTTCPDGTTVAVDAEIIRTSDRRAFRVTSIIKEEGKGRYGKVTITARSVHDVSDVLTLSRHDLAGFSVNLSTIPASEPDWYVAERDEEYITDPDGYMQKKEDEEIANLNFRFRHGILYPEDVPRAKALGLAWAEDYIDPSRR